ncbi:MAG: aldo/keto reductase [Bacteroidales bacterium]|jgi:aryl-alcohol dehydrogenase-like predicted oxidoreductase|nr:aldo/keto reductase [Bacteroidales bacterium]
MKYLKENSIKTNGFNLSRIGSGGMRMGNNPEEGIKVIHTALDAGINFLNTGDFYDHGMNEMLLREALKSRKREDVFISVKFGGMISPDGRFYGIDDRPEHVKNYLAYTLKRLGTDYVDLYQPARIDPHIPVEETIGAIAEMVQAGYVKNIGISEVDGETLRRANSTHPIRLVEVRYSLMDRHIEDDLLPTARELGVGIVAFGVLLAGIIGGSSPQEKLSGMSNCISSKSLNDIQKNLSSADGLKQIADEKGISLAQLAIAWVLAQGEDIMALVGSRTVAQIQDSLKAINVNITKNDLERMEQLIPKSQANCSYMLDLNLDEKGLFR